MYYLLQYQVVEVKLQHSELSHQLHHTQQSTKVCTPQDD